MASQFKSLKNVNDKFWESQDWEIDDFISTEASPNLPNSTFSFENILKENKGQIKEKDIEMMTALVRRKSGDNNIEKKHLEVYSLKKYVTVHNNYRSQKWVDIQNDENWESSYKCENSLGPNKLKFKRVSQKSTREERKVQIDNRNRLSSSRILASLL